MNSPKSHESKKELTPELDRKAKAQRDGQLKRKEAKDTIKSARKLKFSNGD